MEMKNFKNAVQKNQRTDEDVYLPFPKIIREIAQVRSFVQTK